jgi:lysozyme family protein
MYTPAFLAALRATVLDPNVEGGLVRSRISNDPGGDTFAGIARAFHGDWQGWALLERGEPYDSPRLADLVKAFYWRNFWVEINGENLPPRIAQLVFDMAVNSDPDDAKKCLQRAVGVKDDGDIGAKTIGAVRHADLKHLATLFNAQRCRHYAKTKQARESNTGGWWNRMALQLERGVE